MKKMYLLFAVALLCTTAAVNAQKTKSKATKSTVNSGKVKAGKPKVTAVAEAVKDEHAGHNHGSTVSAVAQAQGNNVSGVAVAEAKANMEDNLQLAETTFDFGKIPQSKPVYHDFKITNNGKTELKLENVQASCGCTTPEWQPGPYKSGESGNIKVGFNAGSVGPFNKSVTITYNGGMVKVLTISGDVQAAPATPAPENKGLEMMKKGK
jgi:hypothetical protein